MKRQYSRLVVVLQLCYCVYPFPVCFLYLCLNVSDVIGEPGVILGGAVCAVTPVYRRPQYCRVLRRAWRRAGRYLPRLRLALSQCGQVFPHTV